MSSFLSLISAGAHWLVPFLAKEHFPSTLTFSHFPVAVAVVEQEKWKSGYERDAVVVKQENLSLLRFHSYQLCDLSKAT